MVRGLSQIYQIYLRSITVPRTRPAARKLHRLIYLCSLMLQLFIYPIGIPALYAASLWRNRDILSDDSKLQLEETAGYPNIGHVRFLTAGYRREFYWFEALECVRRLFLASIVGIVSEDSAASPVLGILIGLIFIHVFTELKPFQSIKDSRYSSTSKSSGDSVAQSCLVPVP